MDINEKIWQELLQNDFAISTDTRKDLKGTIYFGLQGDNFDGNDFVSEAIAGGAVCAVTQDPKNVGEKIYLVDDTLKTLQEMARRYGQTFTIPVIVIGGSNGKTTSKDLLRDVLRTKYKTHATDGSLNNHIGVPLSIISMKKETEMAVFEIGANHLGEHTELLDIISPTHIVVTNNGMDHLEGFGTPDGSRKANKELYDWALVHNAQTFVHKKHQDLIFDSEKTQRILYPDTSIEIENAMPLEIKYDNKKYQTHLVGEYNTENIELALSIGQYFKIDDESILKAISEYVPMSKRSEYREKDGNFFVVDCYNANPSSMMLSLESFERSVKYPRGLVIGDMLELGNYAEKEHAKIVDWVSQHDFDTVIYIGDNFKKAFENMTKSEDEKLASRTTELFSNSLLARDWFTSQNFKGQTFLLKGSRGIKVEKILETIL